MKEKLKNLLTVKSIVTIALTAVFAVLALTNRVTAQEFLTIFTVIIGFYFGTQHEKKAAQAAESAAALPAQACDTAACPYLGTTTDTKEFDPLEGAGV